MCGIIGYFGEVITKEKFELSGNKTIYRGPDMTNYLYLEKAYLGFHRLSIMGLTNDGMQPFILNKKYLLCNGEIYGFRKLKDELSTHYTFKSGSDCEILIPLYEKYGLEMFKMLDAEFAMVLYDENKKEFIAGRDPMGIRPLFYGYNNSNSDIAFASEAKNLKDLCDKVMPFPPGCYYYKGEFVSYNDLSDVKLYHDHDIDEICENINNKLTSGVYKRLDSDVPLGFLLSGGLDSSLICAIAAKHLNRPIRTFAIGMEKDAIDLKYAKDVADYIKSDHTEIFMTKQDVLDALDYVIYTLETYDITTIRASIGMYLICKEITKQTDIRVLMTGEISDELFGYKYTDFAPNSLEFQKEAQKRIKELYMYDVLRADRCISSNSMESRVPFGDIDFVNYVMSINPSKKMNTYGQGKYLLRRAFSDSSYLPNDILYREKAAFSDAVGHSMVDYLKEYANNLYTDDEYNNLIKKYSHSTPFTKESLLYREIFEKHYPNMSDMVIDFWMPNKCWEGCDVDDPSARVLKNYGDSGK